MASWDLVGKRVVLRPMRLDEAATLATWMGRTREEVLQRWPPVFFDDAYPQKGRAFVIEAGGSGLGVIVHGAIWGDPRNVLVELVLAPDVGAEEGSDALEALAPYLFESLSARHLWAELDAADPRLPAAFAGAGFARARRTAEGREAWTRERVKRPSRR